MGDTFSKVSSFYCKDESNHITPWEPKTCVFIVNKIDGGEAIQIAQKEMDMSPYVEQSEVPDTLFFECDAAIGLNIQVEWSIMSTTQPKKNQSSSYPSQGQMKVTDNFTEEQI